MEQEDRRSNIELLRIVAMLMIIFFHFAIHGQFDYRTSGISIPRLWYNFILIGGKVGVDIFVLISGYFLIDNVDSVFNFKRLLKVWGEVFFYSIAFYIIFRIVGIYDFDIKTIKETLFPITYARWWFPSTYFVLYIVHPFLNKFLRSLDKKTYQTLLIITFFMWSIIPSIFESSFESNSLIWFVCLYSLAGYINIFGFSKNIKTKHYLIVFIVSLLISYITSFIYTMASLNSSSYYDYIIYYYGQEKITTLLISLSLFMLFLNLNIKYKKWINVLASTTFGVYLLHDYEPLRPYLWVNLFKNATYQSSILLIPYSIGVVLLVYVICILIDLLRKKYFEKPYMTLLDKLADVIVRPVSRFVGVIRNKILG